MQDEITDRIIGSVADVYGVLARAIAATTAKKPPETLTPYEAVWRFFLAQQRGRWKNTARAHCTRKCRRASAGLRGSLGGTGRFASSMNIGISSTLGQIHWSAPCSRQSALSMPILPVKWPIVAFAVTQYCRGDLSAFREAAVQRTLTLILAVVTPWPILAGFSVTRATGSVALS